MKRKRNPLWHWAGGLAALCLLVVVSGTGVVHAGGTNPAAKAKTDASQNLYNGSISDQWRAIKDGKAGKVSIPDQKSAILIQTGGQDWRVFRLETLFQWTAIAIAVTVGLLALFYIIRGRVRVASGMSGRTIERFTFIERMMHWTLAVSFIVLALTGLNLVYGRAYVLPVIGASGFASLTMIGKWLHNFMGFAFMIALVWTFISWVAHNIPSKLDLNWLKAGGGIVGDKHPPAKKFNAGQKIIFWLVILGGVSLSISGLALMMPFEWQLFSHTNALFNIVGFDLPTNLTVIQETQLAQMWHAILAVFMVLVILAHIYIGTIGMEGAFDAMADGQVDENWAREHHSLWVEEMQRGETKT